MRRARLPPSYLASPTTDGRLSHNAVRSQMPAEEVTNTLQVSVPLRPSRVCVHICVYECEIGEGGGAKSVFFAGRGERN